MKIGIVFKASGFLAIIISISMAFSLLFTISDGGQGALPLIYGIFFGLFLGFSMIFFGNYLNRGNGDRNLELNIKEAFGVVTFAWIVASIIGAIPFYFGGLAPSWTDAFFESISGFTTTGATILVDIENNPKGLLFWRGFTHWLGGMGIIVLSLAILPFIGIGGRQLFIAETPGPAPEKLTPRIRQTAIFLWGVYLFLTGAQTLLLLIGGMSFFDALCHSFSTMATGGFSTRNASIGAFESPFIQWIILVFMFIAGTNFILLFHGLRGNFRAFWKDEEFRFYTFFVVFSGAIIATIVYLSGNIGPGHDIIRHSLFYGLSFVTTTGFTIVDHQFWPVGVKGFFFVLCFVGACGGSTSGAIKMMRVQILIKRIKLELHRLLHPQRIMRLRFNNIALTDETLGSIMAFFILYGGVFSLGSIILSALGLDFETSVSACASCLGNVGLGLGKIGTSGNYREIPMLGKWLLSFLMLLGRLGLFTVIMLFLPATWKD